MPRTDSIRHAAGVRLRFGGYQGESSVHTRALRRLAGEIVRRSAPDAGREPAAGREGAIEVEVTADVTAEGRKAADLLNLVERGELDLCYFASSYLAGRVPALGIFDLPFVISDRADVHRRLDGALGARLGAAVASATGYAVLGFWDNGFRHISNRLRPIRQPQDCRGLRIRTLDNALHHEVFAALGFEPVTLDVKDLVPAVRSHAVDAQENPLTNTANFGLYEVHRHVSLTAHFFGIALLLVNRARFEAWPEIVREILRAAAAEATAAQRGFAAREDAQCLARLWQVGVEVQTEDRLDRAGFETAVAEIRRRELARIDPQILTELR